MFMMELLTIAGIGLSDPEVSFSPMLLTMLIFKCWAKKLVQGKPGSELVVSGCVCYKCKVVNLNFTEVEATKHLLQGKRFHMDSYCGITDPHALLCLMVTCVLKPREFQYKTLQSL